VKQAERSVDIVIFRFDREELETALEAAVARGVQVRALIAHTNRGGEKGLRKLELKLLDAGVTVSRTADDLLRYHGKLMIVDDQLYVFGFNYTKLDIEKSRSFGIVTADKRLVKEASSLIQADTTRQPYAPGSDRLVVSPENSRPVLTDFLAGAQKQLLLYDEKLTDNRMQRILRDRAKAGVEVRVIGKVEKDLGEVHERKMAGLRLHVRAIVRDGSDAFVGSQSLRKLELDGRREVGVIVNDTGIAKQIQDVFEEDWRRAGGKSAAKAGKAAEAAAS
jgi:phosphatidylserine/phosphatidylglycerophosphate/cardiolipin synthase-like enzyme